jgi:hypothetical protein
MVQLLRDADLTRVAIHAVHELGVQFRLAAGEVGIHESGSPALQ